jgi:hypothetical protein
MSVYRMALSSRVSCCKVASSGEEEEEEERKGSKAEAKPRRDPSSMPNGTPMDSNAESNPSWRDDSFPAVIPSR